MSFRLKRKILLNNRQEDKVRYITPKNNGEISNSITQNWTEQAIRCYKSKCDCSGCSISHSNYSFICQMPKIINILLNQIGPPDQERMEKLLV